MSNKMNAETTETMSQVMAKMKSTSSSPVTIDILDSWFSQCKRVIYRERRKRNNEASRKSRAIRKQKHRETESRMFLLEEENVTLKDQLRMVKDEVEQLRALLQEKNSQQSPLIVDCSRCGNRINST